MLHSSNQPIANEINRDIRLAYTLFKLENSTVCICWFNLALNIVEGDKAKHKQKLIHDTFYFPFCAELSDTEQQKTTRI